MRFIDPSAWESATFFAIALLEVDQVGFMIRYDGDKEKDETLSQTSRTS